LLVALAWMDWYKLTSLKSYLGIGLASQSFSQIPLVAKKRIIIIPKKQASKRPKGLG